MSGPLIAFVILIICVLVFAAMPRSTFNRRRLTLKDRLLSTVAEKPRSRRLR